MNEHFEVNEKGGKQSDIGRRYDLIHPWSLMRLAETLHGGAVKYGEGNYRLIDPESHLNHAINHIYLYFAGDYKEDHLAHALCRVLFAMETDDARGTVKVDPDR